MFICAWPRSPSTRAGSARAAAGPRASVGPIFWAWQVTVCTWAAAKATSVGASGLRSIKPSHVERALACSERWPRCKLQHWHRHCLNSTGSWPPSFRPSAQDRRFAGTSWELGAGSGKGRDGGRDLKMEGREEEHARDEGRPGQDWSRLTYGRSRTRTGLGAHSRT